MSDFVEITDSFQLLDSMTHPLQEFKS